jgi:hypothetical protein
MPNEEKITAELLKETGYTSWFEFVINTRGSACSKEKCRYDYLDAEGSKKAIELEIAPRFLERLALEEAKLILPLISLKSFAAFDELPPSASTWIDDKVYIFNVVNVDKNGQVSLKRIKYKRSEVDRLQKWETQYKDELVYVEKVIPDNIEQKAPDVR